MVYGRAKSYTDYYKSKDDTPAEDRQEDTPVKADSMVAARKAALKRRLLNKKKVV